MYTPLYLFFQNNQYLLIITIFQIESYMTYITSESRMFTLHDFMFILFKGRVLQTLTAHLKIQNKFRINLE